jgi:two-component system cell cycle sensor histidine kinase/response regulator CckA
LKDHMGDNIFFLPKPFTLKQLAAKVKDVMG